MSNRGFKGFRRPEQVEAERLDAALKRMSLDDRYIFWTGDEYKRRAQSLRSQSLACLTEKKRPVRIDTWIKRAATCVDAERRIGFSPERVREGLYLHRNSKPAVFIELVKDKNGNFRSAWAVPNAQGYPKGLKAGDIVIPAKDTEKQLPAPKGKQAPAPTIEQGAVVTEQPSA